MGEDLGKEWKRMEPWEQHSSVISIPRFDYNAPISLLHHSHSGFLITCTIKREKSATKEAMSILQKYVRSLDTGSSESLESSDANADAKRRKMCTDAIDRKCANGVDSEGATDTFGDSSEIPIDSCLSSEKMDTKVEKGFLSLVKLTGSGLLLLIFPRDNSLDTLDIVSRIIKSMESGTLRSPLWCHRIFPIQSTCSLNEKELQVVVSKLVLQFVNDKQNKLARPVKFAVGYNRRGIEEKEMKIPKNTSNDSNLFTLLDRNKCFAVVAAAVKDAVSDSVVDLKSPEMSVLVELLPLSAVPNGSLVVAVSVLPPSLVITKPRLCIKPLVSGYKAEEWKELKRPGEC